MTIIVYPMISMSAQIDMSSSSLHKALVKSHNTSIGSDVVCLDDEIMDLSKGEKNLRDSKESNSKDNYKNNGRNDNRKIGRNNSRNSSNEKQKSGRESRGWQEVKDNFVEIY